MKRREFIAMLGAATWPIAAPAQQPESMRRIAALMSRPEGDPEERDYIGAFLQRLNELGWNKGRNLRFDIRWGAGDVERYRRCAAELVALAPDVILCTTGPIVAELQKVTRAIAIVFVGVVDPVGAGFVESLARPGGNTTGFALFEYAIAAKWLGLLREIGPGVTRIAVLRDPTATGGIGQFAAIQTVAPLGMELSVIGLQNGDALERGIAAFARGSRGGLLVTASPFGRNHPGLVAALAARYKLPTVYPFRYFVAAGGLMSYGPDPARHYRPAADYVDRILKGEKPRDLPVQASDKYDLVINLKAAKALGIEIAPSLLARADEVIE